MKEPLLTLLGNRRADDFLQNYWQKKPLLIRQAIDPGQYPMLSPDELAGLACEPDVDARIVQEHHCDGPWQVSYGPFSNDDFAALPDSHWTLLVTDCEKHLPDLRPLIELFRFIPDWRIDDLMISYASDQGSVGPHLDAYDVFLLQLEGTREWQISTHSEPDHLIEDIDLKILKSFHPEQSWKLLPGDMLYLPPGIAHHGIARDPCMTASIGFRAPAYRDLLQARFDTLIMKTDEEARLQDPGRTPQSQPAEITPETISTFQNLLTDLLNQNKADFPAWLGCFLTEPKHDHLAGLPSLGDKTIAKRLNKNHGIERNAFSRLAYTIEPSTLLFFADAISWKISIDYLKDVQKICHQHRFQPHDLPHHDHPEIHQLLSDLIHNHTFLFSED